MTSNGCHSQPTRTDRYWVHARLCFAGDTSSPWAFHHRYLTAFPAPGNGAEQQKKTQHSLSSMASKTRKASFRFRSQQRKASHGILAGQPRPTAVVAGNDEIGLRGLWRSTQRHFPSKSKDDIQFLWWFDDRGKGKLVLLDPPLSNGSRPHKNPPKEGDREKNLHEDGWLERLHPFHEWTSDRGAFFQRGVRF